MDTATPSIPSSAPSNPWEVYLHQQRARKDSGMERFRVLDFQDRWCGDYFAASEVEAISLAIASGYDAWSVDIHPPLAGH